MTNTKLLPQTGDTIHDSSYGNFICCTEKYLRDTYDLGYKDVQETRVYCVRPEKNTIGVGWMSYKLDQVPPFTQCFKNKPKDVVYYTKVTTEDSNKDFMLWSTLKPFHNLKLTFYGVTDELKASEVISSN